MGRLRQKGERTNIIFNELDLVILKITSQPKDIAVIQLKDMLNMTHSNLKRHLDWLEQLELIKKIPIPGTRRIILKSTGEGQTILRILSKNIPKDTFIKH